MNNGTDQRQNQPTDKQCGELARIAHGKLAEIIAVYCRTTSGGEIQALLKGGLAKIIERQLSPLFASADPHRALRAYWEKIYCDHYGLEADFSQVYVPPLPTEGKWRYIFILKGLTMNHAAAMYRKIIVAHDSNWGFWKYNDDLDATVTNNARTSKESYVICVCDEPEPDKEYLGKSAADADPNCVIGVTLLERLVHGLVHFIETKRHLDEKGWTLCTGSRSADGGIPCVYWGSGYRWVCVGRFDVRSADSGSGLRQAVSR
jgi:RimJ/RimL family protein N-acetyltransferase